MILAVLRRLRLMVVTLAAISVLSFLIIQAPPGNYLDTYITQLRMQGDAIDDARIEALEARYGLERPMHVQYLKWIWGVLRGDLGRSMAHNMEVNELLAQRLPASLAISTISLILVYLIGLPIGIYSATRQYSAGDYLFTFIGFMGLAIPNFLFALNLLWLTFAATGNAAIGLFSAEYLFAPWSLAKLLDFLKHIWVVVVIIGTAGTAGTIRVMRSQMLDVLSEPYIDTARMKGLSSAQVYFKHGLRVAINPIISSIGLSFPGIISGATIVSLVLLLPLIGPLLLNALMSEDMYLASTIIVLLTFALVIGNFLADLTLAWLDPRIRLES